MRIFNHHIQLPILLLWAIEFLIFVGSVYAASEIRLGNVENFRATYGPIWPRAITIALVMTISLAAVGLYQVRQRADRIGVLLRIVVAYFGGSIVLAFLFYSIPDLSLWRGFFAISLVVSFVGVIAARIGFSRIVDENYFKRRVLVYGAGQRAKSILALRRKTDQRGFRVIGFVPVGGDLVEVDEHRLVQVDGLLDYTRANDIDEIVVAMDDRRKSFPIEQLLACRLSGIGVTDLLQFLERETGKVNTDLLNPSYIIFSEGFSQHPFRQSSSRVLDLLASVILLIVTAPIMLVTALLILLQDGRPVLYRQPRVGYNGRVFDLLKFRSMRTDAEEAGKPQWAAKDDDRVTRVGRFIRKFRIDELPQVFNVMSGHMSLVGPRPERPEFVDELAETIPYYRERHCVKPGITGWAQLCYPYGSSTEGAVQKLQYDLYYVKNHSLMFDVMILLQTAEVVLWAKGSR